MILDASRILAEKTKSYCNSLLYNEALFEEIDDILNSEEYPIDYPVNDTGMSIF